jgi:hypothetical protein
VSADLLADPVPGEWYLDVQCPHCDEIVLVLPNASCGKVKWPPDLGPGHSWAGPFRRGKRSG